MVRATQVAGVSGLPDPHHGLVVLVAYQVSGAHIFKISEAYDVPKWLTGY